MHEGDKDVAEDGDEERTATSEAQAPQGIILTEHTAGVVPVSTGPMGDRTQASPPPEDSASTPQADALDKASAPQGITAAERAELAHKDKTEAPEAGRDESSASKIGAEGKPAVKLDAGLMQPPLAESEEPSRLMAPPATLAAPVAAQVTLAAAAGVPSQPICVVSEVPLGAVPVEIGLKSLAGINHFEIRLDPVELGRIEVRLEIDREGSVKAHLSVDRVETLALLQRDAKTLERAFDQAGLKLSDGNIDLSLRDQQAQSQGRHEHGGEHRRDGARHSDPERQANADPAPAELPRRLRRGAVGIDVRI
jgi:flagellar hook-length control protein FliK